jgi:hypothetical protein
MPDSLKTKLECATLAQAGRVEFFKQSLTLSLAGVAGCAALFTGSGGLPGDTGSLVAACASGALLLLTAAWSLMGLSTYANLLGVIGKGEDPAKFLKGMVGHARGAFLLLALTALAISVYAGLRLGAPAKQESGGPLLWVGGSANGPIKVRSLRCAANAVVVDTVGGSTVLCLDDANLAKLAAPVAKPLALPSSLPKALASPSVGAGGAKSGAVYRAPR